MKSFAIKLWVPCTSMPKTRSLPINSMPLTFTHSMGLPSMKRFKWIFSLSLFSGDKMAELVVEIPDELEELKSVSRINWQLAVEKRLKEEFEELARIKRIVAKSKLTEEQAKELADEVNLALAKRYLKLSKRK